MCGIAAGQTYCWGAGSNGQLGHDSTQSAWAPVAINDQLTQVFASSWHFTCGLDAQGFAWC